MTRYKATAAGQVPLSAEEEAELDANQAQHESLLAAQARTKRDALLAGCDWVVIKASETQSVLTPEWAAYRQALRDVPQQPGFPTNIDWPTKP